MCPSKFDLKLLMRQVTLSLRAATVKLGGSTISCLSWLLQATKIRFLEWHTTCSILRLRSRMRACVMASRACGCGWRMATMRSVATDAHSRHKSSSLHERPQATLSYQSTTPLTYTRAAALLVLELPHYEYCKYLKEMHICRSQSS